MFSLEAMLEVFGEPGIADRLERVAFNAYPAAISEDYMSHQYLQQANQILVSRAKRNWFNNGDDSNLFGLEPNFGCCTANMHQGWPKLVQHLWFWEGSYLVSAIPAPNRLHTTAGGKRIAIDVETDYPFGDTVTYLVREAETNVSLKIRIPGWCQKPELLAEGAQVRREGKDFWIADYSVSSTKPWNYALNLQDIPKTEIREKVQNPFSHETPPSQIRIKAKRVKEWEMVCNSAGPVPDSPVSSAEKEERITLIPYGATALRISQFPHY